MMKALIIAYVLLGFNLMTFGQILLIDGMAEYKTAAIKPEIKSFFEKNIYPKARKHFQPSAECDEEFEIVDAAAIPYLTEKIYLYTYCDTVTSSYQGFVILDQGKLIDHWFFSTSNLRYSNLFYRNGLIVLSGSGTTQNSDYSIVTTLEYPSDIQRSFAIYENDCDHNGKGCNEKASKIYFEVGDGFFYWIQNYKMLNGNWIIKGKRKSSDVKEEGEVDRLENIQKLTIEE